MTPRTVRLRLRRMRIDDAAALHAILSDPEALRYWHTLAHTTIDETVAWMRRIVESQDPDECDEFVIERNGHVIGMIGCVQVPWISFLVARAEWGKGYAREALQAYLRHVFARGRLKCLLAATNEHNLAAQALLKGAGFRETGRSNHLWHVQGMPSNAIHYQRDAPGYQLDDIDIVAIAARHAAEGPAQA